jgi:RNA polymerase sigma-70 factor (ECF subfamily)
MDRSSACLLMSLSDQEYAALVAAHYAQLYRFALSLARNEADASDLTQQAFYLLATKGAQIREQAKAKSWLATTLYREFLNSRRRTTRFEHVSVEQDAAELPSSDPDLARHLDGNTAVAALQEVPEPYRAPLALFYLQDHSYQEIASILDIPIGTVMSRLSRGKSELRRLLTETPSTATNIIPMRREA